MPVKEGDYKVGPGKPPLHTRFQKGQSGNPRGGRAKNLPSLLSAAARGASPAQPALQANTRPPTFALFASKPAELPDSYRRHLVNALRQDFDLPGTPIHMILRKGKNPYQPR